MPTPASNQNQAAERYARQWYKKMTEIWEDRLHLMQINRTGALLRSVGGAGLHTSGSELEAEFRFLQYGIYVDRGTGKGYTRGNAGNLAFLGKAYRRKKGLGQPRQKRPWFSVSWAISVEVMKNALARITKEQIAAIFD